MVKKYCATEDQSPHSLWFSTADTESVPKLDPHRTILFQSKPDEHLCNSISADFYRQRVLSIHKWARQLGTNTFLTDYSTPFGLLALETLLALRKGDDSFRVFSFRSCYIGSRRTYRTVVESNLELILLVSQSDYCYSGSSPQACAHIYSHVAIDCSEYRVWIAK